MMAETIICCAFQQPLALTQRLYRIFALIDILYLPFYTTEIVNVFDSDMRLINGPAFLADLLLLYGFALFAGVIVPHLMGTHFRGFFCNDESIQYAYKEDTVTPTVLFLYVFLVMIVTVVATEMYRARISKTEGALPRYKLGSATIHATIVQVIIYIGYSQIGFVCVFVLTNLTKHCLGRLRPHFLDVCKPLNITCNGHEYYDKYVCSGNPDMVNEARKSFFSGHSSFAMYASTFAAVYLLARMPRHTLGRAVLPVIQTSLLAIGLLISYSRINDNKHHWSDVIAGILVGMVAAICTCVMWGRMFTKPSDEVLPICRLNTEYASGSAVTSAGTGHEYDNSEEK